jgi:hypothetical protein
MRSVRRASGLVQTPQGLPMAPAVQNAPTFLKQTRQSCSKRVVTGTWNSGHALSPSETRFSEQLKPAARALSTEGVGQGRRNYS